MVRGIKLILEDGSYIYMEPTSERYNGEPKLRFTVGRGSESIQLLIDGGEGSAIKAALSQMI